MQTASAEHKESFKADEIKRLTESGWKQKITAEHLRSSIPRLEDLKLKAGKDVEECQKELEALDPQDKTRETREKRKAIERKIEGGIRGMKFVDTKIEQIQKQIDALEEQSQTEYKRAQFIEENFPACLDYKQPEEAVEPSADNGVKAS